MERAAHHAVPSTRNVRVEKFNYEINVRVIVPIRQLVNVLEAAGLLSKYDAVAVGAFSALMVPLMQVGLDWLRESWNAHRVHAISGRPGSGGKPTDRMRVFPHPAGQVCLPASFDGISEYEAAHGPLRRHPESGWEHDILLGQPFQQYQRATAVAAAVGGAQAEQAWTEIVNLQFDRFIRAFVTYSAVATPDCRCEIHCSWRLRPRSKHSP